jgi:uncharacterized protein YbjT (DUF2867 family)
MKIKAIITGATGMVGEGVLLECLQSPEVEQVLVVNRKPCGVAHPKLKEILHQDFLDISPIANQLTDYNACYFCLGVSSVGISAETYQKYTYDLTMHFASTIAPLNPGMTFIYVSGSGTDSSEKGSLRWARVKGKTENDLMKLPFKKVYAFRPGIMVPAQGAKNTLKGYNYFTWLFPIVLRFPKYACKLSEVGQAMINAVSKGYEKNILEMKDIIKLARK